MPTRLTIINRRQSEAKLIVLCCGCVCLYLLATVGTGLFQKTGATAKTPPDSLVSAAPIKTHAKLAASYGKLPLSFEANQGQADARVRFLARGDGCTIFLTDNEAVLILRKSQPGMSRFDKFGFLGRFDPLARLTRVQHAGRACYGLRLHGESKRRGLEDGVNPPSVR